MATAPLPVEPARIRTALVVLSVGMALIVAGAYAVIAFTDRVSRGALFFVVPVVAFLIPMLLSAFQLPGGARSRALIFALLAAAIASATLAVCGLLEVTAWYCWFGGALLSLLAGLVAASGAGETRFRPVPSA